MAASVDVFTLIESIAMESSLPPTPVSRLKTYPFGGETTVQFIIVSLADYCVPMVIKSILFWMVVSYVLWRRRGFLFVGV